MGMMIKKLDPNDPKVARNRALFRAGIPATSTQYQIGTCLVERLKEIISVAKACGITIPFEDCGYDEFTETIYVKEN